ncbi:fungal-specific transcription factor domain-containing protein [Amylocarpus encephaloides]|uniref:Fungal-specific transcription factor domain-containing protein n=1 Tax=Amylocarpus encephaloides TaxID=45428 RepID=A0A9P8C610_9HELO|nr:fungal-specific transcription factor domain-containing protein [Amylocarpus encephaloides]
MDADQNTSPVAPEPRTAAPSQRKRRRPALSCVECRRRKIKCDRNIPCAPCTQSKSATCTYSPEGFARKGGHMPSNQGAREAISQPSATPQHSGDAALATDGQAFSSQVSQVLSFDPRPPERSPTPTSEHTSIASTSQYGEQDAKALAERVKRLEGLLASTSISENGNEGKGKIHAKDLRGNLAKTRWCGMSHWMQAFVQARRIICFEFNTGTMEDIHLKDLKQNEELTTLVDRCKVLARIIKAEQMPKWSLWGVSYKKHIPPKSICNELVKHYFRTHEAHYRILHIPSFEKEYAEFSSFPELASTVASVKVLLVMAIGVTFYQGPDFEELRSSAYHWIYAAQSWISAPNEKSRLHTSLIQIYCLSLIARAIHSINGDLTWITIGSVYRAAIQMGFHRDPKHFPRILPLHGEIRRRLWATILEMNVQGSIDYGMSPMMSEYDYDTEAPANINDEDISEAMTTQPVSKPKEVFTQTSIQIAMLSSFSTRLETCRIVNDFRFEPSYDEIIRLSTSLTKSFKENHIFISHAQHSSTQEQGLKPSALDIKLLDLITQRFLLALHRSFAIKARSDPRYYYSHKIYIDSALAVMSHPESETLTPVSSPKHAQELQDDFTRLRLISGGFLKSIIFHAVIVIYLEMILPLEEDISLSQSTDQRVHRAPYRKFLEEILEISLQRIELGETNVKAHLMFSIALAHIDALEQGKSSEQGIIQAARDSSMLCEKILLKRVPKKQEPHCSNFEEPTASFAGAGVEAAPSLGVESQQAFGAQEMDLTMQDWGMMDFEIGNDSWLFPAWTDGSMKPNAGPGLW